MNELSIFKNGEMTEENFERRIVFNSGCTEVDAFNAMYGGNEKLSEYMGEEITITGVTISTSLVNKEMNNEESGKIVKPCVALVTEEAGVITTVSNGIYSCIKGMLSMVSFDIHKVIAKIVEVNTKKGKAHSLRMIRIVEKNE